MEHSPRHLSPVPPPFDIEEELDEVALNLCEINTASWSSNHAPWGLPQRLGRVPLTELAWDVAGVRSAPSNLASPQAAGEAEEEAPICSALSYHELNSDSVSSRGSGVGAAALNFCDINTASWSSRDSRSPWFSLGAAASGKVRARSTDHAARAAAAEEAHASHLHTEANACSWRSRSSAAALNLCDANTASWGSTTSRLGLHPPGHTRRSVRSVKDLLEDFALLSATAGGGAIASESASSSSEVPRGGGVESEGGGTGHKTPTRLEAGSIAALQAELLAKEKLGGSSHHHHHRIGAHVPSTHMHPMWAKFHEGLHHSHAHPGTHLAHGSGHHVHASGHHSHSSGHLSHSVGHHSHSGGHHSLSAGHLAHSSKHAWESPPVLESVRIRLSPEPLQFAFRISASKFQSKDQQVVSEMFYVRFGDAKVPFRVRVIAKPVHRHKHGQCFRTARGRGRLELKCEGEPPEDAEPVRFTFGIGASERLERRCDPIEHDFSSSSVCGLPAGAEDWDFKAVADSGGSAACSVTLEILPSPSAKVCAQATAHAAHPDFVAEGNDELGFSPGGHLSTIAENAAEM